MKIGIITLPLHTNYGGILQAYALQIVLERMGHEVRIIRTKPFFCKQPVWVKFYHITKQIIKKFILHQKNVIIDEEKFGRKISQDVRLYTDSFLEKIHFFDVLKLKHIKTDNFDAYIVGSDQVWRKVYFERMTGEKICEAFLSFAANWNVKKISYAPSFGTDKWELTKKETAKCKNLIKKFNAISVRELSGINLCKEYMKAKATLVLDPTMLLQISEYKKLIKDAELPKCKGTLHYCILDKTKLKLELIDYIAKKRGLNVFRVNVNPYDLDLKPKDRIQPPVEQWLQAFDDSEFIVTDSFHACVFSILFNKQFVVIGNKNRGISRINSLLNLFGLETRLVSSICEYEALQPINYEYVNEKLIIEKEKSLNFLKSALN